MKNKSIDAIELIRRAVSGEAISVTDALSIYADPSNWGTINNPQHGCRWVWQGPTLPPYELAQFCLREK